jgi:hypothetical protein
MNWLMKSEIIGKTGIVLNVSGLLGVLFFGIRMILSNNLLIDTNYLYVVITWGITFLGFIMVMIQCLGENL